MEKYSQDFISLSPQEFCADIVSEPTYYRSDVFVTYEQIVKMEVGAKAVVYTRLSGCGFETMPERIDNSKYNISYYTVERETQQTPLGVFPQIHISKCSREQAISFLQVD